MVNKRSLTQELVGRLEASFKQEDGEVPPYAVPAGVNPELDRQITEMNERIASIAEALEGAGLIAKQVGVVRIPKLKKPAE